MWCKASNNGHLSAAVFQPSAHGMSTALRRHWQQFMVDEEGVTSIEYALLGSLIVIVAFLAITQVGLNLGLLYGQIAAVVIAAV